MNFMKAHFTRRERRESEEPQTEALVSQNHSVKKKNTTHKFTNIGEQKKFKASKNRA